MLLGSARLVNLREDLSESQASSEGAIEIAMRHSSPLGS